MNKKLILALVVVGIGISVPMIYAQTVTRTLEQVDSDLAAAEFEIQVMNQTIKSLRTDLTTVAGRTLQMDSFQIVTEGNFVPSRNSDPHRHEADCGSAIAISGRVIVKDINLIDNFQIYQITAQNDPVHRVSYEFTNTSPNKELPLQFISDCVGITFQ